MTGVFSQLLGDFTGGNRTAVREWYRCHQPPEPCVRSGVSDFKNLKVRRKGHALALNVHRVVSRTRGRNTVSLRSQMLRAAMSIPANIVEGSAKGNDRELVRFLKISLGSTSELEYHLIVARDTRVLGATDFHALTAQTIEIRKMLHGLIRNLKPYAPPVKSPSS